MTKQEFLQARAKADYLKRNGVTKCAPMVVIQDETIKGRNNPRAFRSRVMARVAKTMTHHPTDEEGNPEIIRPRGSRGYSRG